MGGTEETDPRIKGTPIDFSRRHPVYDLHLERLGPEFSLLDEQRL